jgi:hypothetical protein
MITPEILALMNRTGELVTDKMIDTLISNGSLATGGLARGIAYSVSETKDGITTQITIPGYGEFVDKGRRAGAKMPPVQPIIEWVKVKRITTPRYTTEQMGWAIAKSIAKKGIRPKPFIENSIQFVLQNFTQELTEAGAVDINNIIVSEFRKIPGITITES